MQALVIVIGTFVALLTAAVVRDTLWLIIQGLSIIALGLLVLISRKSMINLSEDGPMKEVSGNEAIRWGVLYIFFGSGLLLIYLFI